MLKIRLARGGAKKRPYYSIVVADSHSPRDGRFIEKVGSYNPLLKKDDPNRVVLKVERIQEWMGKGAQPTDRVARELSHARRGKWEHGNNPKKGLPGEKAKERVEEKAKREADRAGRHRGSQEQPARPRRNRWPKKSSGAEEAAAEEAPAEEPVAEEAPAAEAAAEEAPPPKPRRRSARPPKPPRKSPAAEEAAAEPAAEAGEDREAA